MRWRRNKFDVTPIPSTCTSYINNDWKKWQYFIDNAAMAFSLLFRGGVESNEFGIDFYRIFQIIFHLSNQSNYKFLNRIERILNESSIWKIWLHPIVGVESHKFWINFYRIFQIIFHLSNQSNFKFLNRIEQILNKSNFW